MPTPRPGEGASPEPHGSEPREEASGARVSVIGMVGSDQARRAVVGAVGDLVGRGAHLELCLGETWAHVEECSGAGHGHVLLLVEASVLDDVRRLNFLRRVNARGMAADLMVLRHVPAGAKAEGATGPVVDLPAELHPEELIMEGRSGPSLRRLAHELVRRTRGRLRRQLAEWLLAGSQAVEARLLLTAAVGIARQQRVTGKQLAGDLGWRREKLWECCVAEFGLSAREVIDLVNMVAVGPPMSTGAYPPQVVAQAFGWSKKGSVIGLFRRVTGEPPPESDGTTGGGRVTAELLEAWLLRGWGERDGREP